MALQELKSVHRIQFMAPKLSRQEPRKVQPRGIRPSAHRSVVKETDIMNPTGDGQTGQHPAIGGHTILISSIWSMSTTLDADDFVSFCQVN